MSYRIGMVWRVECNVVGDTKCRRPPGCGWKKGQAKPMRPRNGETMKTSNGLLIAAAVTLMGVTGCATKNYVKTQTAPIIDHTNTLDQKTAENNRNLHDADDR